MKEAQDVDPLDILFPTPIYQSDTLTVWYVSGEFRAELLRNGRVLKFQDTRAEFQARAEREDMPAATRRVALDLLAKTGAPQE